MTPAKCLANRPRRLAFLSFLAAATLCGCRRDDTTTSPSPQRTPSADAAPSSDQASSPIAADLAERIRNSTDEDWLAASDVRLSQWRHVNDLPQDLAQFETVFWDAGDTESLRQWIREHSMSDKRVMEIGTGTGLVSLCCIQAGATDVVATDINPNALANLYYNAERLGFLKPSHPATLDIRWVPNDDSSAFSVLHPTETFDLIISNPPWENQKPESLADYAFYDENFQLLESLLAGLDQRLTAHGRCLLAYGCRDAIKTVLRRAEHHQLDATVLDDRDLDDLPEVFVPGMLIEVKRKQEF